MSSVRRQQSRLLRLWLNKKDTPQGNNNSNDNNNQEEEDNDDKKAAAEEPVFFDDFGGHVVGSSSSSNSDTTAAASSLDDTTAAAAAASTTSQLQLQQRIQSLQQQERQKDAIRVQNWKTGNWNVRGFSLDPVSATTTAAEMESTNQKEEQQPAVTVCNIVPASSSDDDDTDTDEKTIWVGRTNGSVLQVRLGTEYWAHFRSKLTAQEQPSNQNENNNSSTNNNNTFVQVTSKLVRDDEHDVMFADSLNQKSQDNDEDEDEDWNLAQNSLSQQQQQQQQQHEPFQILHQFKTSTDTPIVAMLAHRNSHLFTANQGSGDITQYLLSSSSSSSSSSSLTTTTNSNNENDNHPPVASATLTGAHTDTILCLKAVSLSSSNNDDEEEDGVLFSASADGSIALWAADTGDLLYKCQIVSDDDSAQDNINKKNALLITSADCNGRYIFLGTAGGQVLAYTVQDLLQSASQGANDDENNNNNNDTVVCPVPNGQWQATDGDNIAITSIVCGGEGSMGRARGQSTLVLLTGDATGLIKQWEILPRITTTTTSTTTTGGSSSGIADSDNNKRRTAVRLEQWPKLSTQRLAKKAHIFTGHDGAISSLLAMDATKFVSASTDGTVRAWNPATGKELFRMDGFTDAVRSLCLVNPTMLVTDGMEKFVCVHDFDIDPYDEQSGQVNYLEEL